MKNKIHKKGSTWDQNPSVMSGFKVRLPSGWENRTALQSSLSQWSSHRQETLLAVVESSSGTFWNPASSIWANHDAGSSRSHDTATKGGEWKKKNIRNEGKNTRREEGDRAQAFVKTTHRTNIMKHHTALQLGAVWTCGSHSEEFHSPLLPQDKNPPHCASIYILPRKWPLFTSANKATESEDILT